MAGGASPRASGPHHGPPGGLDTIFNDVDLDDDVGLVDAEVLEMLLNR
jgi:hypothetical protein